MAAGLTVAPGAASAVLPVTGSESLAAGATPTTVFPGGSAQAAAPVAVSFSNTFGTGDTITLQIEPNGAANPTTAGHAVDFSALPTFALSGGATGDTVPTYTVQQTAADTVVIKLTNSALSTSLPTDTWTITVSNISYTVGADAGAPSPQPYPIDLAASYTPSGGSSQPLTGSPVTNAYLYDYRMSEAPTGVAEGSTATPIGTMYLTESVPGTLAAGSYTIAPSGTTPLTSGSLVGTVTIAATQLTVAALPSSGTCPAAGGSSSVAVTANAGGQLQFCVVSVSSGTPGSLTVSGMSYTPPSATGPIAVQLTHGTGASAVTYQTGQPAITVVSNPRIAGYTADDTAAQSAKSLYSSPMNSGQGGAVILASDSEYQDALAASFLGHAPLPYQNVITGSTGTMSGAVPILLNPVNPPTQGESTTAAAGAIQALGASTVYVVGGTYVISDAVVTQLEQIKAGSSSTGLQVVRIAGVTAEQTASTIATYQKWATSLYSLPATPGAYGRYNSGASESASGPASGTVPTAILADADEFQDALAVSPLAYADSLPVLLNAGGAGLDTNAAGALQTLGVHQVIVVGGSAAVSDQAVADLEAIPNMSVLRVAGTTFDATAAELAGFELNSYTAPSGTTAGVPDGLASTAQGDGGPTLTVGTSRGDAYQDALSASQVLGDTTKTALSPLLLTGGSDILPAATAALLGADGTGPAGGLTIYSSSGTASVEHILGDVVFGGTLAQTPALVASELDAIAAG